jgi:hypothetical protein
MSDDVAPPVKGITKAFDTGLKLAKKASKTTGSGTGSAAQLLQLCESAKRLQKSLEESSRTINNAYREILASCGEAFPKSLVEDCKFCCPSLSSRALTNDLLASLQGKLKDLRNDVMEHVAECQEFDEDEPDTFAASQLFFANLETNAYDCANTCVKLLNGVRTRVLEVESSGLKERVDDDRTLLSSMRQLNEVKTSPKPSQQWGLLSTPLAPESSKPTLAINPPAFEPPKPKSPWVIDTSSQLDHTDPSLGTTPSPNTRDMAELPHANNHAPRLIERDIVRNRLSENDDFLERRRQSRILFQKQLRNSTTSIEEYRASEAYSDSSIFQSPILEHSSNFSSSFERRRASNFLGNGSPLLGGMRSPVSSLMDGRGSRMSGSVYFDNLPPSMASEQVPGPVSHSSRGSTASSIPPELRPRAESLASQESIFRLDPLTPVGSDRGSAAVDRWDASAIATTLRLPGFGDGVEPGLEPVDRVDRGNGLMLATDGQTTNEVTTPAARAPVKYPIPHDSSFYKFGGFCEGAKAMRRGESGFKIVKRPSVCLTIP